MNKALSIIQTWHRQEIFNRIVVNAKDGSALVYIPAGEFEMGDWHRSDFPMHRVELSAYWIGVYAVTNAQYLAFIEATGNRVPDQAEYGEPIWKGRTFPRGKADDPVVCVSWDDSVAYAGWAGCELASEAQWEKACRGPLGCKYPWGTEWNESRCRNYKNNGNVETAPVYEYPGGVSGYGTYNQSGNVWEWCADWYRKGYYRESPKKDPQGPDEGWHRVDRGGSWRSVDPGGFLAAYRGWRAPGYRCVYRGFRLVRSAS